MKAMRHPGSLARHFGQEKRKTAGETESEVIAEK
jgi:hypothetical protein